MQGWLDQMKKHKNAEYQNIEQLTDSCE